jgi:hypothetical protein
VEYEIKVISHISLETIRDSVLEILEKHPDAKYYFNISGGTKVLSIGLFVMSLWLEGTAYHIDSSNHFQKLTVPKMHVKDISQNPNYVNILEILKKSPGNKLSRIQLFTTLKDKYQPVRELKGKDERKLTGGVLTKLISNLIKWGLVEEGYKEGSKKEKEYMITEDGLFALKFMKSQGDKINLSF